MEERKIDELMARLVESQVETDRRQKVTDRQLRELGRQIGGLGEKFGSFTEGMALPSMEKLLTERFGMQVIAPRVRVRRKGHTHELDVLAYSNTDRNQAILVEVKSHLREEGLEAFLRNLRAFPELFPEHRDKELFGILAVIDVPEDLRRRVLAEGIYLARISGETFELDVPADFEPRAFHGGSRKG